MFESVSEGAKGEREWGPPRRREGLMQGPDGKTAENGKVASVAQGRAGGDPGGRQGWRTSTEHETLSESLCPEPREAFKGMGAGSDIQGTLGVYAGAQFSGSHGPRASPPSLSSSANGWGHSREQRSEPGHGGGRAGTDGRRVGAQHHLLSPVLAELRPPGLPSPDPAHTPAPGAAEHTSRGFRMPPLPWLQHRCRESATCMVSQGRR